MSIQIELIGVAVNEVISVFKRSFSIRPIETVSVFIGFTVSIIVIIFTLIDLNSTFFNKEALRTNEIEVRLKKLNEVQNSLSELGKFIELQKQSIVNENKVLQSLREEKENLEPIVKANKELIDRIFRQQEKRSKWEFWLSIGLGFIFGIIASFMGSVLYSSYKKIQKNKASA
jgi:hypothetical protein